MTTRRVRVAPLPAWLDLHRLLCGHPFQLEALEDTWVAATLELDTHAAADLSARLRALGLAGRAITVDIDPPLPRAAVRAARSAEAKRLRTGAPGFERRGVQLDDEGRHSLTPEALALTLGRRARAQGLHHVLDACCGAGGNAIGFARAGCHVTALERDPARLAMAEHNARIYDVADRIHFIEGDATQLLATEEADLLFIDPPWGGAYDRTRVTLADLPLLQRLLPHTARFEQTWLKLPPSFDTTELPTYRPTAMFGTGEGDQNRVKFLLLSH